MLQSASVASVALDQQHTFCCTIQVPGLDRFLAVPASILVSAAADQAVLDWKLALWRQRPNC